MSSFSNFVHFLRLELFRRPSARLIVHCDRHGIECDSIQLNIKRKQTTATPWMLSEVPKPTGRNRRTLDFNSLPHSRLLLNIHFCLPHSECLGKCFITQNWFDFIPSSPPCSLDVFISFAFLTPPCV